MTSIAAQSVHRFADLKQLYSEMTASPEFQAVFGEPLGLTVSGPGEAPVLAQMTSVFAYENCSMLAVQNVPREHTRQYGIVKASTYRERLDAVSAIVEKPMPDVAPSTLAVVGRYILTPRIFDYLDHIGAGAGGEIQLTDGIAALMASERLLAYHYAGTRYDCGSKLGYLQATTAMGLKHPETGEAYRSFLQQMQLEQRP